MLAYIEEDRKYVEIAGFRGISIQNTEDFMKSASRDKQLSIWVQFFNADLIATWEHLYFAALNALLAYRNRRNISKTIAMETMIYASAQRQIRKAIAMLGVKRDSSNVAVIIIGDKTDTVQKTFSAIKNCIAVGADETVLEMTQEKTEKICKAYGITEKELASVSTESNNDKGIVGLVIERMALMQTRL
jgi:tRNA threonylcarbamoyladenosine modification (KEOPS) complex Cgi121 subunit